MKEKLLQFIWQQKLLLGLKNLTTQKGESVTILYPGNLNDNAGPDFFNAKIQINKDIWVGNVEIHIKSSDWFKHRHHEDKAYDNVIFHVVLEDDNADVPVPTLEIGPLIPQSMFAAYNTLMLKTHRVPCQKILSIPDSNIVERFLLRLAIERLEDKCKALSIELGRLKNNWEIVFYQTLAKYFGMTINAEPFTQLANNLPPILLARHKHNRTQIDSLVLGVAGFLPPYSSHWYTNLLIREFAFLKRKYELVSLPSFMWKFARTRPANFPTIRLAQFSALLYQSSSLFSKLMSSTSTNEALDLLRAIPSPELNLNTLHHAHHGNHQQPGNMFLYQLLINVVIPLKLIYGRHTHQERLCEQALDWLEVIPSEECGTTTFWKKFGVEAQHALHSQGLIQLRKQYCVKQRCLECVFGKHILNKHA